MMGVFAEFERAMIQERVRAGLRRAKDEGKQFGRPKIAADVEAAIQASLRRKDRLASANRRQARHQRQHGAAHRARPMIDTRRSLGAGGPPRWDPRPPSTICRSAEPGRAVQRWPTPPSWGPHPGAFSTGGARRQRGRSQQPMPVIGFLRSSSLAGSTYLLSALRRGLNELESQNVVINAAARRIDLIGCRRGRPSTQATRRFCFAKELKPSHACKERASALSPISSMCPAWISRCSVECPIQTAVMLRSEARTCRPTS